MISKKQLNMYLLDIESMSHDYITDKDESVKSFMWTRMNGSLCAGAELGVFKCYPKGFVSCMSGDVYWLCEGDWKYRLFLDVLRKEYLMSGRDDDEFINQLGDRIHANLLDNMTDEAKQVLGGE